MILVTSFLGQDNVQVLFHQTRALLEQDHAIWPGHLLKLPD